MTISDGMALPFGSVDANTVVPDLTGARAPARARVTATRRDGNVVTLPVAVPTDDSASGRDGATAGAVAGRLAGIARAVGADASGSWMVRAHPPALADRWATRVPDKARVPGRCASAASTALWVGWVVGNHLTLPLTVLLYATAWVHEHPARWIPIYLAALAVTGLWLT